MIHYVTSPGHVGPIKGYLGEWGKPVESFFRVHLYDEAPKKDEVSGTLIFADVERAPGESMVAWNEMAKSLGDGVRVLNRPYVSMRREQLLRALHESGVNSFRCFHADEPWDGMRFPVFVRSSAEHSGPLTGLIQDAGALRSELGRLSSSTAPPLLIVEHVDVGDERGVYRKYSSFMAGGELIAHHVMFRTSWVVKGPSLSAPWMVEEERRYQKEAPFADVIRDVFRAARIEYGRVDFGVKDGRPQIWEINTNPTILFPRRAYSPEHAVAKEWFSARLNAAFSRLV